MCPPACWHMERKPSYITFCFIYKMSVPRLSVHAEQQRLYPRTGWQFKLQLSMSVLKFPTQSLYVSVLQRPRQRCPNAARKQSPVLRCHGRSSAKALGLSGWLPHSRVFPAWLIEIKEGTRWLESCAAGVTNNQSHIQISACVLKPNQGKAKSQKGC